MPRHALVGLFAIVFFTLSGDRQSFAQSGSLKHVKANGTDLAYVEMGEGVPVVFVHGAIADHRHWAAQMLPFAKHYRAISYSRRYHSPNERASDGSDYTRALHAADLVAFLQALKLPPAHLIGHSYGGSVAAMVAAEHAELVRSLVLLEPSLFSLLADDEEGKALISAQSAGMGKVVERLDRGENEQALREFVSIVAGAEAFDRTQRAARAEMMENLRTLKPTLVGNRSAAPFTSQKAATIKAPTLLLLGERSPRIFHLTNEKLASCLPEARRATIKGVSHFAAREDAEAFNKVTLDFLTKNSM
jgi:non-heme chloroperoxidase